MIVALLGSARFFLALAGMDVGTSFGGIGSSREMMIASLAEPAMLMVVFTLALIAGSTQLSTVAGYMMSPQVGLRVSLGLALVALVIVAIAENARIPVDNPATHLELTMVHEAMVLEYSGRHLAVIEAAASLKLLLYMSLIACVFAPWGMAQAGAGPRCLRHRGRRLRREARGRRRAAGDVRDCDRQDARVPRAGIPRRRVDVRVARRLAHVRGEEPVIASAVYDIAHLLAGGMVLVSFMLLYQDRMLWAAERVRAACRGAGPVGRVGGAMCRMRRICSSPPRSRWESRRSSYRSRCTGSCAVSHPPLGRERRRHRPDHAGRAWVWSRSRSI